MKNASKPAAAYPARKQAVIYARVSSKEQEKGGLLDPGAIEVAQGICRSERLRGRAGICGRGDSQADRSRRLRRDGRLSQGASVGSRPAGRKDGPALPQPQGLGDGGRTGRGDALPERRR